MTTPTTDFVMPVSFTLVRQAGSDQLMRVDGGEHYRLEGPSLVAASWSGPQKAEIWHQHKTANGWRWRKLTEFNGGGSHSQGRRKSRGISRGLCSACCDSSRRGGRPQGHTHDLQGLAKAVA